MRLLVAALAVILVSWPAVAAPRVRIAIVDTGLVITDKIYPYLCQSGHADLTGEGIADKNGHGSMIAEVIAQDLSPAEYCLIIIKWFRVKSTDANDLGKAIEVANIEKAQIINISAAGHGAKAMEADAVMSAITRGATLVVASGNDHEDLSENCDVFPACYPIKNPFFHIVANYLNGAKAPYTNYGGPVTDLEDGRYLMGDHIWTGTSVSAAKVTNRIAKQHAYLKNRK